MIAKSKGHSLAYPAFVLVACSLVLHYRLHPLARLDSESQGLIWAINTIYRPLFHFSFLLGSSFTSHLVVVSELKTYLVGFYSYLTPFWSSSFIVLVLS